MLHASHSELRACWQHLNKDHCPARLLLEKRKKSWHSSFKVRCLAGSGDDYSADIKPTCSLQLTETGNDAAKEVEAKAFRSRCAAGSAWYFSFFFFIVLSMAYSTQPHIRGVSIGRRAQEHVTVGPTPLAHMDLGARKRSGQGGKCQHS